MEAKSPAVCTQIRVCLGHDEGVPGLALDFMADLS